MNVTPGPVAGRLQRPSWRDPRLLVGIALMAIAIVGVTTAVRDADTTTAHYVARETLTPGTVLTEQDLVLAHVRVSQGVYASPAQEIAEGTVVTRVIDQGELVPLSALVPAQDFHSRPVAVQTSLPVSSAIEAGSVVDVWLTQHDDAGPQSRLVASSLVVADVERAEGAFSVGNTETVYVVVPSSQMGAFLDALASDGDISVVGLAGASQ